MLIPTVALHLSVFDVRIASFKCVALKFKYVALENYQAALALPWIMDFVFISFVVVIFFINF